MNFLASRPTLGAIAICMLSACQKEPAVNNPIGGVEIGYAKQPRYLSLWYNGNGIPVGCDLPAHNCTSITFLSPNKTYGVSEVFDAIATGDQQHVVATFSDQRSLLLNVMDQSDIDDVISGRLSASAGTASATQIRYLMLSSTTEVEVAYPFKFE